MEENTKENTKENSEKNSEKNSEDSPNKKRISMLIRVIVILALGFFALDEFYFKNQTPVPTAEEIAAQQMAKKKKRKKMAEVKPDETKEIEGAPSEVVQANLGDKSIEAIPPTEIPAEIPSETPVENINVLEKTTTIPEETVDQKLDKIVESTPVEKIEPIIEPGPEPIKEPVVETIPEPIKDPVAIVTPPVNTNPVEEVKIPSQGKVDEKDLTSESSTSSSASSSSGANNMASKIIETVTETPPPAYDQIGRGLVYNCKDQYWACVDRASYVTCNKNLKYNESIGKSKECVVQAVYATNDDCAKIQKYNVSVSQSTDFCKN